MVDQMVFAHEVALAGPLSHRLVAYLVVVEGWSRHANLLVDLLEVGVAWSHHANQLEDLEVGVAWNHHANLLEVVVLVVVEEWIVVALPALPMEGVEDRHHAFLMVPEKLVA